MLTLYRLLAFVFSPLALWRLHRPARRQPDLRGRWRERLGKFARLDHQPVWIHAASVGEVNAAEALIRSLIERDPDTSILVSTFTCSGAERVAELFGDQIEHRFAPLDTYTSVKRWLAAARPALTVVIETEVWPELFVQLGRRNCPLIVANARLSVRNFSRMRRYGRLFRPALQAVSLALCQSEQDAQRWQQLGVDEQHTPVIGNLKFDSRLPANISARARALREQWGARPTWVAGSTRPGEEAIILGAHRRLRQLHPDALLVLAPRHPERSEVVAELIEKAGFSSQRIDQSIGHDTDVVLVDRLGLLLPCYGAASAAFVGGSLVDIGGHNLLEPAAFGKAVMAGPYLDQQTEMATALREAGGLIEVSNDQQLAEAIDQLWRDPAHALAVGRAALGVVESGRGTLRRTLRLLEPWLSKD
jgi:3-deoxy-D-manno-octulosonic-acid transferase